MAKNICHWYWPVPPAAPVPRIKPPLKENAVSNLIKDWKEETVPVSRAVGEFCEENLTAASAGLVKRSTVIVKTAINEFGTEVLNILKGSNPPEN
jgi:hypothetical protein